MCQNASGKVLERADSRCRSPHIEGAFRPRRDWNGSDVFSFANEVSDDRVLLADLKVFHSESHQFSATDSIPDE